MEFLLVFLVITIFSIGPVYAMQANPSDFLTNTTPAGNRSDEFIGNVSPPDFSQSDFSENMTAVAPSDFSANISDFAEDGRDYLVRPPDLANLNCAMDNYPSVACVIVLDLISLPANRIQDYPLSDQPDYVIKQTLSIIDPANLTKVLQNISPEELNIIKDKITPQTFNATLLRIPEHERDQVIEKLTSN